MRNLVIRQNVQLAKSYTFFQKPLTQRIQIAKTFANF